MGNPIPIKKDMSYDDNLVDFTTKKKEIKGEEIKLRKDGTPKQTINNTKKNRDNVYPFKEDDIPKVVNVFQDRVDNSSDKENEIINRRNLSGYRMSINIGLRSSDFVALRWSDIYDEDWNFLDGKKITPQKTKDKETDTGKHVLLKYNEAFKRAINDYKEFYKPELIDGGYDNYIFRSRVGGHIDPDTWGGIVKKAAIEAGIKYNINSHSCRKTFARVRYDHSIQKDRTLVELMKLFGHASTSVTMHYICISEEELEALYNEVNLGY